MSEVVKTITLICMIFRVLCWITLIIVTFLYIKTLSRKKVFHPNLQLLLFVMPFTYMVFIIPSAFNLIFDKFGIVIPKQFDVILHALTDFGTFGSSFNLFSFTFERLIATWRVDDYEHISARIPYIAIILMSIQWLISAAITSLLYCELISVWLLLSVDGVQWAISVVLFIALPGISRRAYDKRIKNRATNYKHRYQSVENVRTALVLNKLVLFLAVALFLQLSYYSLQWYAISKEINPPFREIFHASVAITPTIGCIIVLSLHPFLRVFLPRFMRSRVYAEEVSDCPRETTASSNELPMVQIRSLSGVDLVIPTQNHRDAYFAEFKRQWS